MKRQFGIAVIAIALQLSLQAALTEELHKTYPLDADGRVSLKNINGAVHITAWDRNEVQVDAVKTANTKEALNEANIVIDSAAGSISIRTRYPEIETRHRDKAKVEYTVKVPRRARLFAVETVNGEVIAQHLANEAKLSTVNGRLEASFDKLEGAPAITLQTVNGTIALSIPEGSNAELTATTVNGGIASDFGISSAVKARRPGGLLSGRIGSGGAHIKLSSVNGAIRILSTSGGRRVVHAD